MAKEKILLILLSVHERRLEACTRSRSRIQFTRSGFIGRATSVIPVRTEAVNKPCDMHSEKAPTTSFKQKVAWLHASATCKAESEIWPFLSGAEGSPLQRVADMKYAMAETEKMTSLPRWKMDVSPEDTDMRVCRTMILKSYRRLEDIGSAKRLHTVFVDVVRGMFTLFFVIT